jgi:two-component system chemotaxis response regulator CheY
MVKPDEAKEERVILIVGDHDDTRQMYAQSLALAGFDVREAADGVTAVTLITAARPDLVVTDLATPGLDNLEFSRRVRTLPNGRRLPIVMVTTHAMDDAVERATNAGVCALHLKPCLPDALLVLVERLLAHGADCLECYTRGDEGRLVRRTVASSVSAWVRKPRFEHRVF